ncbi:MAG: sulfotransferase [Candidatus Andeanibacterium colombiense]|uniref:Sulfotransferase n=1 Tax=Candidatus Andeanibacterium colombiense TaxID=3121345 RepID=A0AAJ6BNZ2_9SPHN|nr:MAG: sulfotransferase [Sphingomonadaceae bacterium]
MHDLLRLTAGAPDPRLRVQQAYAHAALGQLPQALAAAGAALAAPPADLWALDLLGNVFTLCHRPDEAYAAFDRARKLAPDRPDVLFNFAAAAAFMGFTDQAESAYDRVIRAAPDHTEAWLNRSQLRWQTSGHNHVPELRAALGAVPLPWQREVQLRYALGKELEDLGEYDEAFASLSRGAAVRRAHMRYAVAEDVAAMERIAATHDARWCAPAREPHERGGAVFILGLPRSGSTLLERMLGRHSQVQSLGELPYFGQALVGTFRERAGRMPAGKEELIDLSAELDPGAIGDAYLSALAPLRDARPRFVDKLPINFLYAGLIARALPGATLVHIRRRPIDLCFAIFKTLFRDAYPFSYDLAELGAYHRAYRALMDHWRAALGDRLVEIDYEDLVGDPRAAMEMLMPRLGLALEDACLSPEKDRSAVMTASAAQVRQPIHSASVGSAARYAAHLEPLRAALGE